MEQRQPSVQVGVDLGGTKVMVGRVRPGKVPVLDGSPVVRATPARDGAEAVLEAVTGTIASLVGAGGRVDALGIGSPGLVDPSTGRVVAAADTMPWWAGTQVADELLARLRSRGLAGPALRPRVLNDVDAHAVGEARWGAGAGLRRVLLVAVGTGVGAGLVEAGRPFLGRHHGAGELGHLPLPGTYGLRCSCGRTGHLESIGSGPGMLRRFQALGGDAAATTHEVVAAAVHDSAAARALDDSASAVGRALAAAVALVDPDRVVLTGGMSQAGPRWWEHVTAAFRAESPPPLGDVQVVPGALGTQAGVLGAWWWATSGERPPGRGGAGRTRTPGAPEAPAGSGDESR